MISRKEESSGPEWRIQIMIRKSKLIKAPLTTCWKPFVNEKLIFTMRKRRRKVVDSVKQKGLILFGNDKTEPDSKRAANGDNIPFLPNFLLKSLSKEDETNLLKWRKLVNQGRKMRVSDMFSGESNQDKLPKNNEDKKVKPLWRQTTVVEKGLKKGPL